MATPDLYVAPGLRPLLERLRLFCHGEQAIVLITGAPGSGKSTVLRWLYDNLSLDSYDMLLTTMMRRESAPGWLSPRLAETLGREPADDASYAERLRWIVSRLDHLLAERRKLIVAIDQAHLAETPEAWAEVAAILNAQSLAGTCLSFVLAGDPHLPGLISKTPDIVAKIAFHLPLPNLSVAETAHYLEHRLRLVGAPSPFRDAAIAMIHERTGGAHAAINAYAENCLVEAYQRGVKEIDAEIARAAARYLGRSTEVPKPKPQTGAAPTQAWMAPPSMPSAPQATRPAPPSPAQAAPSKGRPATKEATPQAAPPAGRPVPSDPRPERGAKSTIALSSLFKAEPDDPQS